MRATTGFRRSSIELSIQGLNEYGDGTGQAQRRVIRVARTVPGDRVIVDVADDGKRYCYGDLQRVVSPSPQRCESGCDAFLDGCGGCQWLGLAYEAQLAWKNRIVRERIGLRVPVTVPLQSCIGMNKPEAFRNKLSLKNESGRLVFMQEFDDRSLAPVFCKVQTPELSRLWEILRNVDVPPTVKQVHARSSTDGTLGLHLFVREDTKKLRAWVERVATQAVGLAGISATGPQGEFLLIGRPSLMMAMGDFRWEIPHSGFFQTNHEQAALLLEKTMEELDPGKNDRILDLYCGAGFFSVPAAMRSAFVLGVEYSEASIEWANRNARLNGRDILQFVSGDAGDVLGSIREGDFNAMVLDPPRSGCSPEVLRQIQRLGLRRLVYVSCSPDSLARDLKILCSGNRPYRIRTLRTVDLFPHTVHVETICRLERSY